MREEQAKALAKLEAEHALAALAPTPPDSVQLSPKGRRPAWIVYRKKSLTAALDIMALFHCVPFYRFKGTFTELTPDGTQDERSEEVGGPFAVAFDVNQGEGYGPSAQLYFYAGIADPALAPQSRLVRVVIDIDGPDYIGGFSALAAGRQPIMGGRFGNEVIGYRFSANQALNGLADSFVHWGGGDKKDARFTYLFMADQEEAAPMTDETHALGQLRNLRDEFQPAAELIESTARADYYRIPGGKMETGNRREVFAAVKPGAPAPANVAGYYDLDALKKLKGDK
jgi:hypothetical protein